MMSDMESPLVCLVPEGQLSVPEYREWICDMEERLLAYPKSCDRHSQEDIGCKMVNTFTPGLYTRELFMPAGSIVISRIHMYEHPFVISKGVVSVYDGEKIVTLSAPFQGITKPGTKRILYVHEDTIWTTFHVTDKCTMDELDVSGVITCDTFQEFDRAIQKEITL